MPRWQNSGELWHRRCRKTVVTSHGFPARRATRNAGRPLLAAVLLITALHQQGLLARPLTLPNRPGSLKFAVIGDNGTGDSPEYEVGAQMVAARSAFPFDMVIMLGDNMYGRQQPDDFIQKFARPYAPLLEQGVRFYAALGNHDNQENRNYQPFDMGGERYYTYARQNVRFFVLDSNFLDPPQLAWIEAALQSATEEWKICYFHHPLYSDGKTHGSSVDLRVKLEPLFVKYGVNAVFSGHDHVYERLTPQKRIQYFVAGSAGQLRKGDVRRSAMTAAAFDADQSFMLVEIAGSEMYFETVSRTGATVDQGVVRRESSP
jgi:predicted MPP superfamily phosphohydrolase